MLPVEVFLENICHNDSIFLTVPKEEYLIANKKHVQQHISHNTSKGQGKCGLG